MHKKYKIIMSLFVAFISFSLSSCGSSLDRGFVPPNNEHWKRAEFLLGQMSLAQKANQVNGGLYNPSIVSMMSQIYENTLRIPAFVFADGPRGMKSMTDFRKSNTVFPVAILRASAWDIESERKVGEISALELRSMGSYAMLAPCINQVTNPKWGRCQESYGEDVYLLGVMGQAYVEGIQNQGRLMGGDGKPILDENGEPIFYDARYYSEGGYTDNLRSFQVQAIVKHYAVNNWENSRRRASSDLDDRTLREVYLPQFKRAMIKGEAAAVMTAYNLVNKEFCSSNKALLNDIIYDDWNFDGYTITDWYARADGAAKALKAGLGPEMPFSDIVGVNDFYSYGDRLMQAVSRTPSLEKDLDKIVLKILYKKSQFGMLDYGRDSFTVNLNNPEEVSARQTNDGIETDSNVQATLEIARKGIVLLKDGDRSLTSEGTNEIAILPLKKANITPQKPIVVVGRYADGDSKRDFISEYGYEPRMGDVGSSDCKSRRWISVTRGLAAHLGDKTTDGRDPIGPGASVDKLSPIYVGNLVKAYRGLYRSDGDRDTYFPIDDPINTDVAALSALKNASYGIVVCSFIPANLSEIEGGQQPVDGSGEEGEAQDRSNLHLKERDSGNIDALIKIKTDSSNPYHNPDLRIIVLLQTGSSVILEKWADNNNVDVIIQAWYSGMCGGQAIAELIFGETMDRNLIGLEGIEEPGSFTPEKISFTGKTCMTWPRYDSETMRDGAVSVETVQGQLPFVDTNVGTSRSIQNIDYHYYHGYRWFDRPELMQALRSGVTSRSDLVGDNWKTPRYWFGYGLSYNTYTYSGLSVNSNYVDDNNKEWIQVTVSVTNNGNVKADEVVQAYVSFENTGLQFNANAKWNDRNPQWGRPKKQLFAFDRVTLNPKETKTVTMYIDPDDLTYWNGSRLVLESNIDYKVIVASNADDTLPSSLRIVSDPFKL